MYFAPARRAKAAPGERVPIDPYVLAAIRRGLEGAVQDPDGTAYAAFSGFPIPVAGKTGTAEKKGKRDFAWFAGYAPSGAPEVAFCFFIEGGGHGGETAAPLAYRALKKIYGTRNAPRAPAAPSEGFRKQDSGGRDGRAVYPLP